jgi:hypothetical protein
VTGWRDALGAAEGDAEGAVAGPVGALAVDAMIAATEATTTSAATRAYGRSPRSCRTSLILHPVPDPLEAAKTFMDALEARDPERAAAVCAENVQIELPGGDPQLEGRDGARRLVRIAPPFIRRIREQQIDGTTVILRGLTRAPGHFANYTTWTFETDGQLITHVTFAWRPAN